MPLPFGKIRPRSLQYGAQQPIPPQQNGFDFTYAPGNGPADFKPQTLGAGASGLTPASFNLSSVGQHPPMGGGVTGQSRGPHPDQRFFNVGGSDAPRSPVAAPAAGGDWYQAYGASGGNSPHPDQRFFNVGGGAPGAGSPAFAGRAPGVGGEYQAYSPGVKNMRSLNNLQNLGNLNALNSLGEGFDWQPDEIEAPSYGGGGGSAPRARGPLLPNNTAPAYGARQAGTSTSLPAGWWHALNGETLAPGVKMAKNSAGWWHGNGEGQGLNQAMSAQAGGGGGGYGGGGYGGGGYGPAQAAFIAAMNAANAANASRANNLSEGFGALRKWASERLQGYGDQLRRDTDEYWNNQASSAISSLMSSGLANSTTTADEYARNARERTAGMARVTDQVTDKRLNTEIPLALRHLGFMEGIDQTGPDPALAASLAQGAAAGGYGRGYGGAPMMIGSGDVGYQIPGYGMVPMYQRGGSQLQRGSRYVRPTYGKGGGGGTSGLMGGDLGGGHGGASFTDLVRGYNPYNAFGTGGVAGSGEAMGPGLANNGVPFRAFDTYLGDLDGPVAGDVAFPAGTDFGGDWNFGGPRQTAPRFPWMYR